MVDPVSNAGINSLLRTQSTGTSAAIVALKSNQQAQQAIINQLQQSVDQNKAVFAAQSTTKTLPPSSTTLPRGSLLDVYA